MDASVEPVTYALIENPATEGHEFMDRGWSPIDNGTDANEVGNISDLGSVRIQAKEG